MKYILPLLLISLFIACSKKDVKECKISDSKPAQIQTVHVAVEGMSCIGCERLIKNNIMTLDGIKDVTTSYREGKVVIKYDKHKTNVDAIKQKIVEKKYKVVKSYSYNQ